jgi:hypothetical protein
MAGNSNNLDWPHPPAFLFVVVVVVVVIEIFTDYDNDYDNRFADNDTTCRDQAERRMTVTANSLDWWIPSSTPFLFVVVVVVVVLAIVVAIEIFTIMTTITTTASLTTIRPAMIRPNGG